MATKKNQTTLIIVAVVIVIVVALLYSQQKTKDVAAACGKLVIAEQNWASAELMANVDKAILEKGFGCEVELIPGATMPTFTSMDEKGAPDMNPNSGLMLFTTL